MASGRMDAGSSATATAGAGVAPEDPEDLEDPEDTDDTEDPEDPEAAVPAARTCGNTARTIDRTVDPSRRTASAGSAAPMSCSILRKSRSAANESMPPRATSPHRSDRFGHANVSRQCARSADSMLSASAAAPRVASVCAKPAEPSGNGGGTDDPSLLAPIPGWRSSSRATNLLAHSPRLIFPLVVLGAAFFLSSATWHRGIVTPCAFATARMIPSTITPRSAGASSTPSRTSATTARDSRTTWPLQPLQPLQPFPASSCVSKANAAIDPGRRIRALSTPRPRCDQRVSRTVRSTSSGAMFLPPMTIRSLSLPTT